MTFNIKKISKKVWIPVASFLAVLLIGGIALAVNPITHHGTVTVVNPQQYTYTFGVYQDQSATIEIADGNNAFWTLGTVNTGASPTEPKTVFIKNTGTGTLTVTPSVNELTLGDIVFSPTSVQLTSGSVQSITATFTAGQTAGEDSFNVIFTESH